MENNQHLPDELILLILLRLPIKSLMRFKCVSKSWLSLISHPNFGKSHFELSAAPTPKLIYLEPSLSEARTLDVNASLHHDSVVSKFTFPLMLPLDDFSIRGSCRGFILLEDYPFMFLWNPSTGEFQSVFYSGISSGWYASSFLYGFGYDALIDDYLVVIASVGVKSEANIRHIRLEFYSLRTISWKEIAVTHFPYTCRGDQSGLLFNGAIHWVVFRDTDYEDETEGVIIAFDLIERNISEVVPVPSHVYDYSYLYDLRVIDGCLALCYGSFRGEPSEVWVMQEYKVESSWIHFEVFEFPTSRFFPICLTEGGEVVGLDESKDLVKLIVEGDVGKLLEHGAHCHRGEIVMYAESLLSLPPIDGEEAEGDDQQKELGP